MKNEVQKETEKDCQKDREKRSSTNNRIRDMKKTFTFKTTNYDRYLEFVTLLSEQEVEIVDKSQNTRTWQERRVDWSGGHGQRYDKGFKPGYDTKSETTYAVIYKSDKEISL